MDAQLANWDDLRVFLAVARAGSLSGAARSLGAVSYTHLRAHETVLALVCRLLLEKKTY